MKDVALHHAWTVIHYREAVFCASYGAGMHEDQSRTPQKAISERYYFYAELRYPKLDLKHILKQDFFLYIKETLPSKENFLSQENCSYSECKFSFKRDQKIFSQLAKFDFGKISYIFLI